MPQNKINKEANKTYFSEKKGSNVRCEHCRIDNEQQYDPVPDRFEWTKNRLLISYHCCSYRYSF